MRDTALIGLQRWLRTHSLFYRLTVGTRVLLAVGFIPTGMVKLLGHRFAYMDPETPLGGFFETLFLSGPYWRFLGFVQVLAGILVLMRTTATLGALIFFTIMLNIFVITISYDFRLTPFVTGAMLMATLYLLVWDYDRLRGLVVPGGASAAKLAPLPQPRLSGPLERGVYVAGALAGLGFFFGTRGLFVPWSWSPWFLLVSAVSLVGALWLGFSHRTGSVDLSLE
jgi:hypothetical protein